MSKIQILDTTLRDGGYCNNWTFGHLSILKIMEELVNSQIDVIECGFLSKRGGYDKDKSIYHAIGAIPEVNIMQHLNASSIRVCMINYGEYDIESIPNYAEGRVEGFRVAFHKSEKDEALIFCKKLMNKGYKIFVQPMVTSNYSDMEFLDLISVVNSLEPYAFYIVDSFGMMKAKEVTRYLYLCENNLAESVRIGYHAHNNMQLAYSNAKMIAEERCRHDLLIDCCIFGMGRGAGNLNTEIFAEYLNETFGAEYICTNLLRVIDEILMPIYNRHYWGYSLPYYLSAINRCHPNYAEYLDAKKTLTIENISYLIKNIDDSYKYRFNEQYIENIYMNFMGEQNRNKNKKCNNETEFDNLIVGRNILIIAPGKSVESEKYKIEKYCTDFNPIVFSVNFFYDVVEIDFIFISNIRRFEKMKNITEKRIIVTSNINTEEAFFKIDYKSNLTDEKYVVDNAGLMLIHFLLQKKVKKIILAGFDGYSVDVADNYVDDNMSQMYDRTRMKNINRDFNKVIQTYSKKVSIEMLTDERYLYI